MKRMQEFCLLAIQFVLFSLPKDSHCVPLKWGERIINGKTASVGQFPFQVSLQMKPNNRHYCGGSIITPNIIVTAAHCILRAKHPSNISVKLGMVKLSDPNAQTYEVKDAIISPTYDRPNNDIALLLMKTPLSLRSTGSVTTADVIPIAKHLFRAKECEVSGWGLAQYSMPDELMYASLPFVDNEECQRIYLGYNNITDHMLCFGGAEKDTCQGDSGGPLICRNSMQEQYLAGITSFGLGCGNKNVPGVYTRIDVFSQWIKNISSSYATSDSKIREFSSDFPIFMETP